MTFWMSCASLERYRRPRMGSRCPKIAPKSTGSLEIPQSHWRSQCEGREFDPPPLHQSNQQLADLRGDFPEHQAASRQQKAVMKNRPGAGFFLSAVCRHHSNSCRTSRERSLNLDQARLQSAHRRNDGNAAHPHQDRRGSADARSVRDIPARAASVGDGGSVTDGSALQIPQAKKRSSRPEQAYARLSASAFLRNRHATNPA